ncbi:hypothetical protein DFY39_24170, partial [Escherichia coli]|nr:hypothetical protein [Escherichia coli]EEZ0166607.1 hypothetical protein [Escherichia coli]
GSARSKKLTTSLIGEGLRRTLSCYALTFQGNILSVNCQCRILIRVRRTTTRSPVLVSISNPEPKWRIKWQNLQSGSNFAIPVPLITISFMNEWKQRDSPERLQPL